MYSHGITKDVLPVEYGGNGGTIKEIIRKKFFKFVLKFI